MFLVLNTKYNSGSVVYCINKVTTFYVTVYTMLRPEKKLGDIKNEFH